VDKEAKMHASHTNQNGLAFFENKGLVDMRIVPRGLTINASYIVVALGKFLKHLKKKRH
jgi:hypothetical protein